MKRKMIICAILVLTMASSMAGCSQASRLSEDEVDGMYVPANGITAGDAGTKSPDVREDYVAEDAMYLPDDSKTVTYGDGEETARSAGVTKDGVTETTVTATTTATVATEDRAEKEKAPEIKLPKAGQLTAGEWCDNENWGFFSNLVESNAIDFPSFGINPTNRTAVKVKAKDGSAVVNAKVKLLDKDSNVLWSAVTNKQGEAFLFNQGDNDGESVEIESEGVKQNIELGKKGGNDQTKKKSDSKELEVVFDGKGKLYDSTDIMFILDTTSSMSDEMLFLQSEFTAITKAVDAEKTRYAVNFYRDDGDEYVTKCSDFTNDVKELQKKLNSEEAEGGGDYPEAVAEILDESIIQGSWNDESVKIAFLIFDAPPHEGKEKMLVEAAKTAAEKGIRIVPVVASDSDIETELFGRAMAITSGGKYVFLTDDSGIGNSHAEPIIGSYEVRPLYEIIVDIINEYKQ